MGQPHPATTNDEAIEAWDGVLFDRFVQFRDVLLEGLGGHGEVALRENPPRPGDRVLDIGCGFGDTAQRLGGLVGPGGEVLGIDAAPRFVETAREEAEEAGIDNLSFAVCDPEEGLDGEFDMAFSRFGTMFFANPVAALRNVRGALVPGGRLCMVVWRSKAENPWLHQAEQTVGAVRDRARGVRRAHLRPGPVRDGERRHHQRDAGERRLRGHLAAAVRPALPDGRRHGRGRGGRDGDRPRRRGDPARGRRGRASCGLRSRRRCARTWPGSRRRRA